MFAYLRYFSAVSFVAIVIVAIFVGFYFKSVATEDFKILVEKNNQALALGFQNTVWEKHNNLMKYMAVVPPREWATTGYQLMQTQDYVNFQRDAIEYFNDLDVIKLNVYTKQGNIILSSNNSNIIYIDESKPSALKRAQGGQNVTRTLEDSKFDTLSGMSKQGTLVQTIMPIISSETKKGKPGTCLPVLVSINVQDKKTTSFEESKSECVDGIIEVYFDITSQWNQLFQFQVIGTFGIIVVFFILLFALYHTSKRAESIIAKQHETNLELAAQAASAEAENREKSQFLANVSHELRTPLNAIIGFSEIIKNEVMGALGNDQYQDYIRDIHSSGVHLLSLINDILDYSKAEAGKLELEIAEVDVTKIVQNSLRLVSPRAEAASVQLVDDMPKEHFVLTTDAKKFKQIMLNLLSNAVKFTPSGGSVRVVAWENFMEESITFEVKDSGIGIAPKDIAKAMAPFGQVDSALSRKYEGTGLGLPLTRKFIEIMGGTFNIQSEVGQGTTIIFTLPKVYTGKAKKPLPAPPA